MTLNFLNATPPDQPRDARHSRSSRESDNHRCFPQPADATAATWRYTNFPEFVAMLSSGLYFSRADLLGDAWEGAMPSGIAPPLPRLRKRFSIEATKHS